MSQLTEKPKRSEGLLADRQSQVAHTVNERLDTVSHRLGDSLQKTTQHTAENLQKLHERLALIDSAQKNIASMMQKVLALYPKIPIGIEGAAGLKGLEAEPVEAIYHQPAAAVILRYHLGYIWLPANNGLVRRSLRRGR